MRRLFSAWLLLGLLLSLTGRPAWAQTPPRCPVTTTPAGCEAPNYPFQAFDKATGALVEELCVGRQVEFRINPSCPRQILPVVFYEVDAGIFTTSRCSFGSPPNPNYTPTAADLAAGYVTVSENANLQNAGMSNPGTLLIRVYRVRQAPASTPSFTLDPCTIGQVRLTLTDNTGYEVYQVQVGSGTKSHLVARDTVITAAPGQSVTLTGSYRAAGPCTGSNSVTVPALVTPQVPAISRLSLQGPLATAGATAPTTFRLSGLQPLYRYGLQVEDASRPGGFRDVGPTLSRAAGSAATDSITLSDAQRGCYRLVQRDVCSREVNVSPAVCTISLSAEAQPGRNLLTFDPAGAFSGYELRRGNTALPRPTPPSYADTTARCGISYRYQVIGTSGGSVSVSNPATVTTSTALARPLAAPLLTAGFNLNNQVLLRARTPGRQPLAADGQLTYRRSLGGTPYTDLSTGSGTARARDNTALSTLLASPPCYQAGFVDRCGNVAPPSNEACPPLLTAAAADPDGRSARLSWTTPTGPDPSQPLSYRVLTVDPAGRVVADSGPLSGNSYTDPNPSEERQVLRYRLLASGAGLLEADSVYSNLATVARRVRIAVPNAFTPNGDGLNDVLEIKGRFLQSFTFVVVDRNGQEVFRTNDRTRTWDGSINGRQPVNGTYVWNLRLTDELGEVVQQSGTVTILK